MKPPKEIWLIDIGGALVWCDEPDPSGYELIEDVTRYKRVNKTSRLTSNAKKLKEIEECCLDQFALCTSGEAQTLARMIYDIITEDEE